MHPIRDHIRQVILDRVRIQLRRYVSERVADQLTATIAENDHAAFIGDMIGVDIATHILTEQLPPKTVAVNIRHSHDIDQDGVAETNAPHFATWQDHWKAAHWDRWWMRALRDLRLVKAPRYVDRAARAYYTATMTTECRHIATVDISTAWTYPQERLQMPELGPPVLKTQPVGYSTPITVEQITAATDTLESEREQWT